MLLLNGAKIERELVLYLRKIGFNDDASSALMGLLTSKTATLKDILIKIYEVPLHLEIRTKRCGL